MGPPAGDSLTLVYTRQSGGTRRITSFRPRSEAAQLVEGRPLAPSLPRGLVHPAFPAHRDERCTDGLARRAAAPLAGTVRDARVPRDRIGQHLDGDTTIQSGVARPIDFVAGAQRGEDFIRTKSRAGRESHSRVTQSRAVEIIVARPCCKGYMTDFVSCIFRPKIAQARRYVTCDSSTAGGR